MVRHRSTAKRRGKTCHRRAMSDTGLVIERQRAETTEYLMCDVGHFVGAGRCGQHTCGQPAIDRLAIVVFFDEIGIAIVFQQRSEEHTSELQSLMRISYAVFCLKKKKKKKIN